MISIELFYYLVYMCKIQLYRTSCLKKLIIELYAKLVFIFVITVRKCNYWTWSMFVFDELAKISSMKFK